MQQAYLYKTISPTQISGLADAILSRVFGFEQVPEMVTLTANQQGHFHFKAQLMYEDTIPFPQKRSTADKEAEKQKVREIATTFFKKTNEIVKANKQPKVENQDYRPMFQDRNVDRGAFPSDFPDLFPLQYLQWQSTEPIFHAEYPKNIHYYEVRFRVELPCMVENKGLLLEKPETATVENPTARLSSAAPENHSPQVQKVVDTFMGNAAKTPPKTATVQNEYVVLHINPDDKRYEIMGVESHFVQIVGQESVELLEIAGENTGLYFLQEANMKLLYWTAEGKVAATKVKGEDSVYIGKEMLEYSQGITIKFDMLYIVQEFAHEINKSNPEKPTTKEAIAIMQDFSQQYPYFEKIEQNYINPFIERLRNTFGVKELSIVPAQRAKRGDKVYWAPGGVDMMSKTFPSNVYCRISIEDAITSEKVKIFSQENIFTTTNYTFWNAIKKGVNLWHKGFYRFKLNGDKGYRAEEDIAVTEKDKTGTIYNDSFEIYGQPDHFINLNSLIGVKSNGDYYVHSTQFSFVINHVFAEHLNGKDKGLDTGKAHLAILYHDIFFYFSLINLKEEGQDALPKDIRLAKEQEQRKKKQDIFNLLWTQITNLGNPYDNTDGKAIVQGSEDNSTETKGMGADLLTSNSIETSFLKIKREWSKTNEPSQLQEWKITRICVLNMHLKTSNDDSQYEGGCYDI